MKTIYLLRHGHATLSGKYIGSTDCPLSEKGFSQIESLRKKELFSSINHIISSPMLRCVQTYQTLGCKPDVIHEENLREIDFGLWEGLSFDEVVKDYPQEFQDWCDSPQDFCFPEGEGVDHLTERLKNIPPLLAELDGNILVVAHGGVIRYLLCLLLNIPATSAMKLQIDLASYARIDVYDDDYILSALNFS